MAGGIDRNSLLEWFPVVEKLGVPVPKTYTIHIDRANIIAALNGMAPLDPTLVQQAKFIVKANFLYPVFLRTDLCSGKHEWQHTCYVPSEDSLESHILSVCAANETKITDGSSTRFAFGLNYSALVLREFLSLETSFIAFAGGMPINKERRYFVRGGKVVCHHPYWPEKAFKTSQRLSHDPEWQSKLAQLNQETPEEIALLTTYAQKVGNVLNDYWSVDFAKGKNGIWYLIDMARGEQSYHWPHEEKA